MSPSEAFDGVVWVLRGVSLAALAAAIASWMVIRRWARATRQAEVAEAARDASRRELERRNRELEALNQVAATIGRRADLPVAAGEILDAVLRLTGLPEGGVYRLDRATNTLALIAQRGYAPEEVALLDGRPAQATMVGQAIAEGRLRITTFQDAPPQNPRLRAMAEQRGLQSQLTLPIAVKGATWGALALCSAEPLRLDAEAVRLVEALTEQISVAVERAELLAGMQEQTRRLETLALLAQTLTSTLSPREVLDTVLEATRSFFGEAAVRVWLVEGEALALGAEAGVRALDPPHALIRLAFGQGLAGRAAEMRVPWVSEDLLGDARAAALDWARAQGLVSGAAFPFVARGRLLGVLTVFTRTPHRFTPDEISGLESFSHQAAIAMDNAALFAEAGQRAAEYRALFEVGQLVGSTLDVDRVLDLIVERCRALVGVHVAGIFRLERDGALVFERGRGLSAEFVRDLRVQLGEGTTGRAVAERQPVWSADLLADAGVTLTSANRALVEREGYRAVLSLPILIKGAPYGALAVYWREPHAPAPAEVELMTALAGQAAIALDNARLYQSAEHRSRRLAALSTLTGLLSSTLSLEEVLARVVRSAVDLFGSSVARLWLVDAGAETLSLRAQAGSLGLEAGVTRLRVGEGLMGRIVATRAPLVVEDLQADARLKNAEPVRAEGVASFAGVPLLLGEQVLGALSIAVRERRLFAEEDMSLLQSLSSQAAIAIENARLYAETQWRLRESATLVEVGRELSRPGPAGEAMRAVARVVGQALGADMGGVYGLNPSRDALVPIAGYRIPPHLVEVLGARPFMLARFPALMESWRAGRAVSSSSVHDDPRFDPATFEAIDPAAMLFAPTPVRGEPLGGLFLVWWGTGREFTPAEVHLVEAVAAQIGLAMENAELERQTQARLAETETLLAVSRTLSSTLDLETMSRHFVRHIVQALGADTGGVWLLDETGQWLEPLAGYRVPTPTLEALRRMRIPIAGNTLYAEAARTLRCVVAAEGDRDPLVPADLRGALAHRTQLFVPIVASGRMTGGFAVTWSREARALSDGELRLVEAVGSQAGAALDNARLFRDNQRRLEELAVLHQLSRAVTGRLDQAELIDTVHQQVARVLDVHDLVILLHDEERAELAVVLRITDGRPDLREPRRHTARLGGLVSVVLESRRPLRTADYLAECARRGKTPVPPTGAPRHWLGVPMTVDGRILGVFVLRAPDRAFTERDERLLVSIADLTALALRSARLFEERSRAYGELSAAQDQLVRTEKLRALGEMASGVAHDFNNVLAAIVGRAQLLLREVGDPRFRRWIEVIERSALDGAHTVRRLQEFTRIRRDQPFVAVDLNRVVREALEGTESRWKEEPPRRGIAVDVVTRLAPDLPAVPGDPAELREALTNLILNALDAMPSGGVLTLESARAGEEVRLAVADTGVGIPEHLRGRIFDPFFTTKGPQGTGLGLSMTYGILSRHGARVALESEESRGTTFVLHFPVTTDEPEPAEPARAEEASAALRCLVVDDEVLVGDVMGDMLSSLGHETVVMRRGDEAVARFGAQPFDVVFTDLSMPGLSGWDVARAIRAASAATPVFLVTGFGVEVAPDELGPQGVDAVLSKPISLQDMVGALATVRRRDAD